MIVICPNCSTKFNLPDDQSKQPAKLRCSVCKHVFDLPYDDPEAPQTRTDDKLDLNLDFASQSPGKKASKGKGGFVKVLLVLLLLGLMGGGGYYAWFMTTWLDQFKPTPQPPAQTEDLISLIALRGVRQYTINNDKAGAISVIEGKAVNGFNMPRELIRVEASLYDKDGKALVSKKLLAGTSVSLFQLQVLGEKELEQALGNKIDVLTYNTNVPPGGEVPFMVVFYNPPKEAAEFGVKILEARNPPPQK